MVPNASELVISNHPGLEEDTFIFEPTRSETSLGWLYAAVETKTAGGVGPDIINTITQALQQEYYRDPNRGILASFESALHQANLVLHDLAEQGIRDWMGYFNVAVGVIASDTTITSSSSTRPSDSMVLHVSTAGDAVALITRNHVITTISAGLSHSPITNPLRTFASVASGSILARDLIFLGTSHFDQLYSPDNLARFVADQSAETITTRLSQLYEDQKNTSPVAAVILAMSARADSDRLITAPPNKPTSSREPIPLSSKITPRQPLKISSSITQRTLLLISRLLIYAWQKTKRVIWPYLKRGSRQSGQVIYSASITATQKMRRLVNKQSNAISSAHSNISGRRVPSTLTPNTIWKNISTSCNWLIKKIIANIKSLPPSSKVFAVMAIILAILLGTSLVFLQQKRVADTQIQHASENLHEARTKKEAAETALIYDNREQARTLLNDAKLLTEEVAKSGLYQQQAQSLLGNITTVRDKLDKITRVSGQDSKLLGNFSTAVPTANLTKIFYLNGSIYSFDPQSNIIIRLNADGSTEQVTNSTQGMGFFTTGSTHEADKSIVFVTDDPGLAIFDAKTSLVQKQEIQLPSNQANILAVATFGNRLYLFDQAAGNIFGFSKTLRGYSGGSPWITDSDLATRDIIDIGVDGYIYTLHQDGTIRKLLKGRPVDFHLQTVQPAITDQASLTINENLKHLYIFDPPHQRVVIFDTVGNLSRQIFLNEEPPITDITVDPKETTLYALGGSKVFAISLEE